MDYKEFIAKQQAEASAKAKETEAKKQEELSGAVEMSYAEYKNKYTHCKTVKDSYNKKTKTISVIINQVKSGACPHCGTYCYGDCQA
jgi:DNA repair exonuclease SbcCD ATPase subunit